MVEKITELQNSVPKHKQSVQLVIESKEPDGRYDGKIYLYEAYWKYDGGKTSPIFLGQINNTEMGMLENKTKDLIIQLRNWAEKQGYAI